MTLPRGICPVCGGNYALRAEGTIRKHLRTLRKNVRGTQPCPGTDRLPDREVSR